MPASALSLWEFIPRVPIFHLAGTAVNSVVHPEGWISVEIAPFFEEQAQKIRANRDRRYGNIFAEAGTDQRWVGDLGEMAFNSWLKHQGLEGIQWVRDDAAGKADFILPGGFRIGVKTVKRQGDPKNDYSAQITARHAEEPVDHYFFLSYHLKARRMWLLGGLERTCFLAEARLYRAGEQVHSHYRIRPGHEILNLPISELIRPLDWLENLISGRLPSCPHREAA